MSIDTAAPQTRRALLFGALGGALASAAAFVRPAVTRAGVDGDLVLEATNNTDAQTELLADTSAAGLRVVATGIGLQGWGDIGVDAYGSTIGVNAVGDDDAAPAVVAYNRANGTGVFGWTTDGNDSPPAMPAKTGVYGLAGEADAASVGVRGAATTGVGVRGEASNGPGVVGIGPLGFVPDPIDWKAGVYGAAAAHPGVFGHGDTAAGVRGASVLGDGVYGETNGGGDHPAHSPGAGVHGHGGFAGVMGTGDSSFGVFAQSNSVPAVYALNSSATVAAIVAEGDPGTAIHGHANAGGANQVNIPPSPALTGIYGSATGTGVAIAADSANGLAVRATSSAGHAIRGRGQLDGVVGESPGNRSGVVGYSGSGNAPAGPGKTGVYGEATQDTASRGVSGFSLAGQGVRGEATTGRGVAGYATTGQGVRGEATTGVGLQAVATTGVALAVSGRATFNRSGRVSVPANRSYVDITVPGGLASTAAVLATLQAFRSGVWVMSARVNYPTAGKVRINLNKVASTTASTPLAWFVLG